MAEAMFDGREILMRHDMFRREFALMPGLVRGAAAGDRERAELIGGHIGVVNVKLHRHHAGQDTFVWPLLLDRCADDVIPVVQLMEGQHDEVTRLGDKMAAALDVWRDQPTADSAAALARALERLIPAVEEHLHAEGTRLVPLMEQHIPADEWDEIAGRGADEADPATLPLGFGMLMYEGDPEVVEAALAHVPPEMRAMLREQGPRAYAAHAELIHGTATPPRSTEVADGTATALRGTES
ncbi:Hemerythrin HHE cation binding domain-containing protein [Streptomyces sp. DvalAA-14]|uniref:hemerythrin domain-containing protein n=1 Tax=unclassified Streptomyces TaxID=2593676 RepID=UPI00081B85AE|nr:MULTISPECIES: hemerythrin domain-containing protein [unclassified Streptomyces]SCE46489.1 Hemerythrin HHE cation binding domain-containing protein [Streptomyces sp. DvalAA-14]